MPPERTLAEPLRVTAELNGLIIEVPWRDAEGLQTHLRRRGIGTTLVLDPRTREARLEVWPGPDDAAVRKVMDGWQAGA
jgi:hypothetical protein